MKHHTLLTFFFLLCSNTALIAETPVLSPEGAATTTLGGLEISIHPNGEVKFDGRRYSCKDRSREKVYNVKGSTIQCTPDRIHIRTPAGVFQLKRDSGDATVADATTGKVQRIKALASSDPDAQQEKTTVISNGGSVVISKDSEIIVVNRPRRRPGHYPGSNHRENTTAGVQGRGIERFEEGVSAQLPGGGSIKSVEKFTVLPQQNLSQQKSGNRAIVVGR